MVKTKSSNGEKHQCQVTKSGKGFKYFPDLSSEILTTHEKSAHITRVVRKVVRYLLEGEVIKEKSKEARVIEELFKKKDIKVQNILDEIEKFIHLASEKTGLDMLYDKLSSPPFGLTRQIISLLLLGILLKQGDRVSIFEKGLFQLEITALLFDRLMVNPHKFELQKNIFTDNKKYYLENLAKLLKEDTNNLLDITKTIVYQIKGLDKYTKHTDSLSKNTLKLRNAILSAKEPYKLIFNDIPVALGFKGYEQCGDEFFNLFNSCLRELENNYALLLAEMEMFLFDSFNLKTGAKGRESLAEKVRAVEEFVSDDEIKTAINSIKIIDLPHNRWLERVATVINRKNVPKNWSDNDLADFKRKILLISSEIKKLKSLSGLQDELEFILELVNRLPGAKKLTLINILKEKTA